MKKITIKSTQAFLRRGKAFFYARPRMISGRDKKLSIIPTKLLRG